MYIVGYYWREEPKKKKREKKEVKWNWLNVFLVLRIQFSSLINCNSSSFCKLAIWVVSGRGFFFQIFFELRKRNLCVNQINICFFILKRRVVIFSVLCSVNVFKVFFSHRDTVLHYKLHILLDVWGEGGGVSDWKKSVLCHFQYNHNCIVCIVVLAPISKEKYIDPLWLSGKCVCSCVFFVWFCFLNLYDLISRFNIWLIFTSFLYQILVMTLDQQYQSKATPKIERFYLSEIHFKSKTDI